MTLRRVRRLCAAAIAFAAIALPPGSAGAHPADCAPTLTAAPSPSGSPTGRDGRRGRAAPRSRRRAGGQAPTTSRSPRTRPTRRRSTARAGRPARFKQVGHDPLMSRGMNAAIAIHGDYAYIGSRTDGGHEGQPHGGVMVVDISDPSDPALLGARFDAKRGRVVARAARLELAGHPDRPEHELRRRRPAAPLHHAVDQQHPLLRHLGSERDRTRSCCTSSTSTRTSSSCGRTRRIPSGR